MSTGARTAVDTTEIDWLLQQCEADMTKQENALREECAAFEMLSRERIDKLRRRADAVKQRREALEHKCANAAQQSTTQPLVLELMAQNPPDQLSSDTALMMRVLAGVPRGPLFDLEMTGDLRYSLSLNGDHYFAILYEAVHTMEHDKLLAAVVVRRAVLPSLMQSSSCS